MKQGNAHLIGAAVAVSLLAGCDTIEDMAIAGTSQCLADTSRHDCILIAPDTQVVAVLVGYPGQPRREAWTVKQVGEQRQLISGKGSTVIAAN